MTKMSNVNSPTRQCACWGALAAGEVAGWGGSRVCPQSWWRRNLDGRALEGNWKGLKTKQNQSYSHAGRKDRRFLHLNLQKKNIYMKAFILSTFIFLLITHPVTIMADHHVSISLCFVPEVSAHAFESIMRASKTSKSVLFTWMTLFTVPVLVVITAWRGRGCWTEWLTGYDI